MNKIFLALILVHVVTNTTAIKNDTNNKAMKKNTFDQIQTRVQDTVNKLFALLQVNKNFTADYKYRLLSNSSSNYPSLKYILENVFQELKIVKRIARVKGSKKSQNGNPNFIKFFEVLVEDTLIPNGIPALFNEAGKMGIKIGIKNPEKTKELIEILNQTLSDETDSDSSETEFPIQELEVYNESNENQINEVVKWRKLAANTTSELNITLARRIFKGETVDVKTFPFMASVHVLEEFNCAASIVTKDWAITAAVCLHIAFKHENFLKDYPQGVTVRIGSDYTNQHGEICTVSKIVFHPDYDPQTLRNNLVLVRLQCKLHYRKKNKKLRRISYKKPDAFQNVKSIILLGWGDKGMQEPNKNSFDPVSIASLDVIELEKCKQIYSSKFVSETNFCTALQTKGSGACQNDVGDPAIANSMLVGVVSFGPPVCGTPDAPTVFTRISLFTTWIDSVVEGKYQELSPVTMSSPTIPLKSFNMINLTAVTVQNRATPNNNMARLSDINLKTAKRIPKLQYSQAIKIVTQILNNLIIQDEHENNTNQPLHYMQVGGADKRVVVNKNQNQPNLIRQMPQLSNYAQKIWPRPENAKKGALRPIDGMFNGNSIMKRKPFSNTDLNSKTASDQQKFLALKRILDSLTPRPTGIQPFTSTYMVDKIPFQANVYKATTSSIMNPQKSYYYQSPYPVPMKKNVEGLFNVPRQEPLRTGQHISYSDNYETEYEKGMSIEIPSNIVVEYGIKNKKSYLGPSPNVQDNILRSPLNQYLKKNYIPKNDILSVATEANKSGDIIVLLLKDRTTKKPVFPRQIKRLRGKNYRLSNPARAQGYPGRLLKFRAEDSGSNDKINSTVSRTNENALNDNYDENTTNTDPFLQEQNEDILVKDKISELFKLNGMNKGNVIENSDLLTSPIAESKENLTVGLNDTVTNDKEGRMTQEDDHLSQAETVEEDAKLLEYFNI